MRTNVRWFGRSSASAAGSSSRRRTGGGPPSVLRRHPVHVVIAKSDLPDGRWQEMLDHLRRLMRPPLLIVTSRTADEHLWAEVLNVGGYDVLAQPFERDWDNCLWI
jgi:DNA-binding response OmpR family regulator